MSIDSQIIEMTDMAVKEGIFIKEVRKESHSAKLSGQRPVFNQLLNDLRYGLFTRILTWAPDRLSRNGSTQERREVTNVLNRQLYIHNETVISLPLI